MLSAMITPRTINTFSENVRLRFLLLFFAMSFTSLQNSQIQIDP